MIINNKGQVAIIVLLISAVVMTIGLSVSRRTVVETKIDNDEEQLKQAFNAAESGIENYIANNGAKNYISSDGSSASIGVTEVGGNSNSLNFGGVTLADATTYYWMVGHNSATGAIDVNSKYGGTTIQVCINPSFSGALKVDFFYQNGGVYRVWRQGYNIGSSLVNGYVLINTDCFDLANIPLAGNIPLLLAIRPLGGATSLEVSGNGNFPIQGEEITSTGSVGNNISQVVKVYRQYRVPVFMLDGVTAGGSVLSN